MLDQSVTGELSNPRASLLAALEGTEFGPLVAARRALQTAGTKEFSSARQQFFKSLKQSFGANVSTQEAQLFMDTLAQLGESEEALIFSLTYLKGLRQLAIEERDLATDLLDENGIPPINLKAQVQKRMKPVFGKFNDNIKNMRTRALTAAAAAPGSGIRLNERELEAARAELERRRGG